MWGQFSVVGILAAGWVFVFVEFVRGNWVPSKQVDQVQEIADTFKEAWQTEQASKHEAMELTKQLMSVAGTVQKVLDALPVPEDARRGDHEA